jgi:sulfite reductase alpha subunit-like flavoprotein
MAIYPRNSKEIVDEVCQIIKIDGKSKVRWPSTKLPFPLPITHFEAIS